MSSSPREGKYWIASGPCWNPTAGGHSILPDRGALRQDELGGFASGSTAMIREHRERVGRTHTEFEWPETIERTPTAEAQITRLDHPGRAFGSSTTVLVMCLAFGPSVLGVLAGGGLIGSAYLHRNSWEIDRQVLWAVSGFVGLVVGVGLSALFGEWLAFLVFAHVVRGDIRERFDAVVDPDDPESVYVERIPRRHWGTPLVYDNDEFGVLQINVARRLIKFEGTYERWLVPAAAIAACRVESYRLPSARPGRPGADRHVLVIQARRAGVLWEAPLSRMRLHLSETHDPHSRFQAALDLHARVAAIL